MERIVRGHYQTNIEIRLAQILDSLNVEYCRYFPIRGTNLELDFAIPDKKICIEADGSFWHKDKNRDRRRDYFLKSRGWTIIRFTDKEIMENEKLVKSRLRLFGYGMSSSDLLE